MLIIGYFVSCAVFIIVLNTVFKQHNWDYVEVCLLSSVWPLTALALFMATVLFKSDPIMLINGFAHLDHKE